MRKILATLGAVALLLTGCESEEDASCGGDGSTMCPGYDCLDCHGSFKVAGTVFSAADSTATVSGVTVTIGQATGPDVILTSNSAGNFYTTQTLTFPLTVTVGAETMMGPITTGNGGCNTCHSSGNRIFP
jgi:hypothetical protein